MKYLKRFFSPAVNPPLDCIQILNDVYGFEIDNVNPDNAKNQDVIIYSQKLKVFISTERIEYNNKFIRDLKSIQKKLNDYNYTMYINICGVDGLRVQWAGLTIDEFVEEVQEEIVNKQGASITITELGIYFKKD